MGGPGSGRKKGSGGSSAGSRSRVKASLERGAKIKRDRIAQSERNKTVGSGSGMLNKKEQKRAERMIKKPRSMP